MNKRKGIQVFKGVVLAAAMLIFLPGINLKAASIETAISWAVGVAGDDSHGYSTIERWGPHYDCSSFVYTAFYQGGFNVPFGSGYTGTQIADFTKAGFIWIPWDQVGDMTNLKRGDILFFRDDVQEIGHTEIYLGNRENVGASSINKGILVKNYYDYPWDGILRYQEGSAATGAGQTAGAGNSGTDSGAGDQSSGEKYQTLDHQEKIIREQKAENDVKGAGFHILCARLKKSSGNSNTIAWNKVKGAAGYILYGSRCGSGGHFRKLYEGKKRSFVHSKLKKGTYYKYIIIACKKDAGKKIVLSTSKTIYVATRGGRAGNPTKIKVNKSKISLKKNKTFIIRARQAGGGSKSKISHYRRLCFESDHPKIAKINSSGKVRGLKKGNCRIYVYAQNGLYKVIKVKIK